MRRIPLLLVACAAAATIAATARGAASVDDPRNIRAGSVIPSEGYADQPFVVVLPDGTWLCVLTTGRGKEGDRGQHVVATRSSDRGRTWSPLVDIEPADGPEASWAVPFLASSGRVYAFYDYNGDRVDTLAGRKIRADMLGWYCYRHSDDGGRAWSKERYRLPMRLTACDRANQWQGKVQVFWGVAKPAESAGSIFVAFTKLGKYMLDNGEGWVCRSDNILTEPDAARLRWELLPEGDAGIRAPEFGSVQEEHNLVPLADGSLYCVYRTAMGFIGHSVSRDAGRAWPKPVPLTYADGRIIKHPRANARIFRSAAGKYLLWHHNNGGRSWDVRNPAWLSGGVEKDGRILWSEPEILLYDPDPKVRMSYPDFIEQGGRFWVTETQKSVARVHEIDKMLLDGLWNQFDNATVAQRGLVLDLDENRCAVGAAVPVPRLPDLAAGGGFTLEAWVDASVQIGVLEYLDTRDEAGRGIALLLTEMGGLAFHLADGRTTAAWRSEIALLHGRWHHVAVIVDGGPKIIMVVIDGRLYDGGAAAQAGWGRFGPALGDVSGKPRAVINMALGGLRIYDRPLRVSEAVGNFRAGR